MSVKVTWGNNSNLYNRDWEHYDSHEWERFVMNTKRGYVIKHTRIEDDEPLSFNCVCGCDLTPMEFIRGLVDIDNLIPYGSIMKKDHNSSVGDLKEWFRDGFGEEYYHWGMNGDNWYRDEDRSVLEVKDDQ